MFHIHTCVESISTTFALHHPLHLPSPIITCAAFLSFIVLVSVHRSVGFCLGILPVNMLSFNQSNPFVTLPYPFPSSLYCSAVLSVFHCVVFLHRRDVFQYYSLSIIVFFPSSLSLL
jgi:hypothetical protein